MTNSNRPIGDLIREWRQRRRLSQLDLACDAEISTKHLSFLETGRSLPSREMLLHLAERMAVPLRDRNVMLRAAGFAPSYQERSLDDPDFRLARQSIDLILTMHDPNPALAVDRHWTMAAANNAATTLMAGVDPLLLTPPVNVIRLSLHPAGLAPRIINLVEWRRHIIERLRQQIEATGDQILANLVAEVRDYPLPPGPSGRPKPLDHEIVAIPFQLATVHGPLSFISTTTVFGTPVDITLSELAIEAFFPADQATVAVMRRLAEEQPAETSRLERRAAAG
ncbi:MAG: helix-turn-helix transcriptional regulator [Acetobacteraceae bacterium]|jgi:transcriptional regulator with XRE-family HTH domain